MSAAQIERVEKIVNSAVAADMEVLPRLKSREDAIAEGAMALFGEKYGETVRTISILVPEIVGEIGDIGHQVAARQGAAHPTALTEQEKKYSYELCGGTHLERTSDVGVFLIVSEGSAAAGVRRIEAVTGRGAYALIRRRFDILEGIAIALKTSIDDVPAKVEGLQSELTSIKRALAELRRRQAMTSLEDGLTQAKMVGSVTVLALNVPGIEVDTLRLLGDKFREQHPRNGVAVLASGPALLSVVTDDLVKRGLKAADLVTAIGGRGGGRPNIAQGSLPDGSDLQEALAKLEAAVGALLK